MSRPKWWHEEWQFWIPYEGGRREYNPYCYQCSRECKQSFRVEIVNCPYYDGGRLKTPLWKVRKQRKNRRRKAKK